LGRHIFKFFLLFLNHSNLVGRSKKFSCWPGKKAGAEAKKGRAKPF